MKKLIYPVQRTISWKSLKLFTSESHTRISSCFGSESETLIKCRIISTIYVIKSYLLFVLVLVSKPAPAWEGKAVVNGEFKDLKLSDYKGI